MNLAEALKGCNTAQKKAVETVEGPVLVIAGPGTGKTHILTLRIANILEKTQAKPSNILVLTFTESATRTVRRRLGEIIGDATARDVFISTFHGFCEHVLSTYPDAFPAWQGKRLAGDVESALLWREVLETENLVHLKTPKSPYFYLKDLARLRDDLVRECITLDQYRAWADELAKTISADPSCRYQRGPQEGELNKKGQEKMERLEKIAEAARLIESYENLKDERGVYDFSDVIRGVVDTMRENETLRADLQEQYQYILADEHQDANALQHALLDLFAFDEHPNIFVVGDERQAIYRFQGADSEHFRTFIERYPRTEVVELTDSFRSLQGILDVSHGLIERHVPEGAPAPKFEPLTAVREGTAEVRLIKAEDPLAERDQVARLIEETIEKGTAPHEIAVIAATNATASAFAEVLSARGIPTLRAGDVLLSSRPMMRSVIALMRAAGNPLDLPALRESLLAPWWDISLEDRALLLQTTRDHELKDALGAKYPDIAKTIRDLQDAALRTAPLELLSKLLQDSGARGYLLSHAEHLDDVILLRKVLMHVEEIVARNPDASFAAVISSLTKAHEHGLESVKSSVTEREGMVTVITAHKAKGMEWEKVLVVGLIARQWEKGGLPAKIPSPVESARSLEDALRLFYVAITRAKDELTLSYAVESAEGKETPPSVLIPENLPTIAPEADPLPILHTTTNAPELVCRLTKAYLTDEGLSPTALSEYLESPPAFFAKRVLRLKEPETPALVIGNAVHAGIAEYLKSWPERSEEAAWRALERSLARSLLPRNAAYDRFAEHARQSLSAYLAAYDGAEPVAVEQVYTQKRKVGKDEVLLQGKVDAVLKTEGGERIVDFKTASQVKGNDEIYARQLAFYDLLLRENGHTPKGAAIIQITPEGVTDHPIGITDESRESLLNTLDEVLTELLSGNWRSAQPSDYDDLLALF